MKIILTKSTSVFENSNFKLFQKYTKLNDCIIT